MTILNYKPDPSETFFYFRIKILMILLWILFSYPFAQSAIAQNSIIVNGVQNNVPIQEVTIVVDRGGPNEQVIVETSSGGQNPIPINARAELESILLQNGDRVFATNRFPVVKSANPLLGTNLDPNGVRVVKYDHATPDQFISHAGNLDQFLKAMGEVVSSPDLRSYWDIGGIGEGVSIFDEDQAFVDIIYPNELPFSGYMLVTERNGNSSYDLLPLDKDGNILQNATRILVRGQFDWNSGINHQINVPQQKQWLTVIQPSLFNVTEPIYGFRVFDIGESDGKFIFFAREISAAPDNAGPIFGFFGEENAVNVFTNDELDGKLLNHADINFSIFDNDGVLSNGFLIIDTDPNSPTFGRVSVPAGTPAGIYSFEYEIEDKLDGRKDRAVVTIRVVDPIDGPDFPDCREFLDFDCNTSSGKITVDGIYLSDAEGNPITESENICELGTFQEVYLALSLTSNSDQPLFETRFFGDLGLGNAKLQVNAFLGTIEPNVSGQIRILSEAFAWNCGDQLLLQDGLVLWLSEELAFDEKVENCDVYNEGYCIAETILSAPSYQDFEITKSATPSTYDFVGQEINYSIKIINTGQVVLTNILVEDPLTGFVQTIDSLEIGVKNEVEFNTVYVITQDDIDRGEVVNTVTAKTQRLQKSAIEIIRSIQTSNLTLTKTADKTSVSAAGEEIVYTLTVTNNGNVTIENVTVVDAKVNINQNVGTLSPGESTTVTATYVVSQADMDAGSIVNVATVSGTDPNGDNTDTEDGVTVDVDQNASLSLTKTADKTSVSAAGEEIVYTLTVTNNGNVTIENVTVVDAKVNINQNVGTLSPGESATVTATYVVSQADMDAGSIVNVATVSGTDPNGDDTDTEDGVTVDAEQIASLTVVKTSDVDQYSELGDIIVYTVTVTNNGTVSLTDVNVVDPLTGYETVIPVIAPGVSISLETSYTVTIEDLESGSILNTVNVVATDPNGNEVTGTDNVTVSGSAKQIIANDDDFGDRFLDFTGVLGNILENDLLEGQRPDPDDVDFEFTELDGIIGLNINENGELSLLIPGINEAREYTLRYVLRETANPTNIDEAIVVFRLLNNEADLSVTKTSNEIEIFEGDEFDYVITVSNVGGTDATEVVVTDDLPNGLTYISSTFVSTNPAVELTTSVQGSRVTWSIPFLPADAVVTITLRVKANALTGNVPVTITNGVTVVSAEDEVTPGDNSDTDVNTVSPFFIPNVITPDGDGKNDTFEIKGLGKFVSNEIIIFNRYGDHVYQRKDYNNDWNAPGQVAGTYFYVLTAVDSQGRTHDFKGWIQVIK